MASTPSVLVIAGLDPSGGAGLLADVQVVRAHGLHVAGVATALTIQDSARCHGFEPVDTDVIQRQLEALLDDLQIAAIKVGMVGGGHMARVLARTLAPLVQRGVPLVFDPVLRASVGADLFEGDPEEELGPLLAATRLLTPNRQEAEALSGIAIASEEGLEGQRRAARALRALGPAAVLVKGGHVGAPDAAEITDLLDDGEGEPLALSAPRLVGPTPHGTGCALSSAIAARLAKGDSLRDAVQGGRGYLASRIAAAFMAGRGRPLLGAVTVEDPGPSATPAAS